MNRLQLIALLCGVCLLAQPFIGSKFAMAEEEEYADEVDDVEEEADQETSMNEKDVVVGTTKNFDSLIKQHKYALVEFYAPWCGHCKSLAPEYAKAATKMKSIDPSILIVKVDATVETELAEKHGVAGYPTLKWFVDGVASEYSGGRDEDAIVSWIKKKTGPPAVTLTSTDALAELEKEEEVLLVAYLLKGDSYKAFVSVAEQTDSVAFAETVDKAVGKAVGLTEAGVAVVKNFKGEFRQVVYVDQPMTKESLETVIREEKLPLTLEFNQANSEKIFGAGIPRHILMLAKEKDLEIASKSMITLREVATAFKGKFVFVTVNADSSDSEPVVKFFELDKEVSPSIVGFMMEPKQQKFKFHEDFTVETLTAFCNSLLDGSLKPEYKSEEVKENDKDGEVVVVVGKSFDKIARDPTKDVLLEVYAPWCGHCKSLAPIYKKLAKRFKDIDSVVIAKLDGTTNEHADLDVQGFPTIIFYPAEEGAAPINYSGERTLKDLTKFIKENAKIPYELKKKSKGDAEEEEEEEKDEL